MCRKLKIGTIFCKKACGKEGHCSGQWPIFYWLKHLEVIYLIYKREFYCWQERILLLTGALWITGKFRMMENRKARKQCFENFKEISGRNWWSKNWSRGESLWITGLTTSFFVIITKQRLGLLLAFPIYPLMKPTRFLIVSGMKELFLQAKEARSIWV